MIKAIDARTRTMENELRYNERFKMATKPYIETMLEKVNSAVETAIANRFYETIVDIETYEWNPQYRDVNLLHRECCELMVEVLRHDYGYKCEICLSNKKIKIEW